MTIHFENKKKEIEVIIQEKKKKKKESMTLRLKEKEQKKTATMVARQSREMLEVLAQKQEELKEELKQEIVAENVRYIIELYYCLVFVVWRHFKNISSIL